MFRSMTGGIAAAAAAFLVAMSAMAAEPDEKKTKDSAPAAQPMTIYENALGEGWENRSTAKTTLPLEIEGSPRKPIKVEAEAGQALHLHHAPFATNGLRKLGFLIQGSVPDKEVRVFMLTDGKPNGEGKLVKFSNTGWTRVEVPLVTLASDDRLVDGLWIQNASAEALPKFYVTEIKLD